MGAGGRMAVPSNSLKRAPVSKPPFTLSQIKKAIPPHCFERSFIRSFSYVVSDLTVSFILYYIADTYIHQQQLPHPALPYLAWPVYWALQGCIFTGIWVLAHECGHGAFSKYQLLNDTIGFFLHTFVLTPYFSWKYSHRRHHSNSGSLDLDENYVPKKKNSVKWFSKYLNNTPGRVFTVTITLTLGLPMYFIFNIYGRPYNRFASHYDPYSPIYSDRERLQIFISDVGLLAVVYGLYRIVAAKGLAYMFCIYGGPLLVVNGFIVLITLLHHTHLSLPHYSGSEWDWFRGSLATVDRDYGILNEVFHHISDTHVAHHLFPTIPQYHAVEATEAIKPILGEYYMFDGTPFYKAIWRQAKECLYVEPDDDIQNKGVFWYTNKIDD